MSSSSKCSVGNELKEACHKTTWIKDIGILEMKELSQDERTLIKLRTGISSDITDICFHHKEFLLKKYSLRQKRCCDPFTIHKKASRGNLLFPSM